MHSYLNTDTDGVVSFETDGCEVAVFTAKSPARESENEDSCAVIPVPNGLVLAVADGIGGHRGGAKASRLAIECLGSALKPSQLKDGSQSLRDAILHGIEAGHDQIRQLGIGAGSTISVAAIIDHDVRFYNVGDSVGLLIGGRGAIKYRTLEHTAGGFGVEAGLIDEQQVVHMEEQHVILNALGTDLLRIEMSTEFKMSPQDMVFIASDGLSDNLHIEDICAGLIKGGASEKLKRVVEMAQKNMEVGTERPAKPDDLTAIVLRIHRE